LAELRFHIVSRACLELQLQYTLLGACYRLGRLGLGPSSVFIVCHVLAWSYSYSTWSLLQAWAAWALAELRFSIFLVLAWSYNYSVQYVELATGLGGLGLGRAPFFEFCHVLAWSYSYSTWSLLRFGGLGFGRAPFLYVFTCLLAATVTVSYSTSDHRLGVTRVCEQSQPPHQPQCHICAVLGMVLSSLMLLGTSLTSSPS
jgi:hypothetical protein